MRHPWGGDGGAEERMRLSSALFYFILFYLYLWSLWELTKRATLGEASPKATCHLLTKNEKENGNLRREGHKGNKLTQEKGEKKKEGLRSFLTREAHMRHRTWEEGTEDWPQGIEA